MRRLLTRLLLKPRPRLKGGLPVEEWERRRAAAHADVERRNAEALHRRTHPPDVDPVSGCCDRLE